MENLILNAVSQLNNLGYFKTNIKEMKNSDTLDFYSRNVSFFNAMLADDGIKKSISLLGRNLSDIPGTKPFEINHFHYLKRALGLNDGAFIRLYLDNFFVRVASEFLNCNNPQLFNVLAWIHPKNKLNRQHSQNWHRDREDFKMLKIFIYYSEIGNSNGPFEYVPKSFCGGDFYGLYEGRDSYMDYTPDIHNTGGPKSLIEIQRCEESYITFIGKPGDIVMVNNSGFHRGGFVRDGIRVVSHGLYIRPDAYQIKNEKYFTSFNYSPSDVNFIDFKSQEFLNLGYKTKFFKTN